MVEEYEQEELAEDSHDEKRMRRAESQPLKKRKKQSANNQGGKRPRIERILPLPLLIKAKSANMKLTKTGRCFEVSCNVFPLLGFLCLLLSLFSTNKLPKL